MKFHTSGATVRSEIKRYIEGKKQRKEKIFDLISTLKRKKKERDF